MVLLFRPAEGLAAAIACTGHFVRAVRLVDEARAARHAAIRTRARAKPASTNTLASQVARKNPSVKLRLALETSASGRAAIDCNAYAGSKQLIRTYCPRRDRSLQRCAPAKRRSIAALHHRKHVQRSLSYQNLVEFCRQCTKQASNNLAPHGCVRHESSGNCH